MDKGCQFLTSKFPSIDWILIIPLSAKRSKLNVHPLHFGSKPNLEFICLQNYKQMCMTFCWVSFLPSDDWLSYIR